MRCPHCGYNNPSTAKFCKHCGRDLSEFSKRYSSMNTSRRPPRKGGDRIKIILGVIIAILIVAVGVLVYQLFAQHKKQEAASQATATTTEATTQAVADATNGSTEDTEKLPYNKYYQPTEEEEDTSPSISTQEVPTEAEKKSTESTKSTTESKKKETKSSDIKKSGDYVISDSDSRYLDEDDLDDLSSDELDIARNEIFARKGRPFEKEKYRNYFNEKSWYHENPDYSDSDLNKYEEKNAGFILKYQQEKGK